VQEEKRANGGGVRIMGKMGAFRIGAKAPNSAREISNERKGGKENLGEGKDSLSGFTG